MAEIQLSAGTLYPPACYSTEQQRFEAYVAAIVATIIGGIQWEASETAPTDTDLWWQKIDSNGRPVEYLRWSTADGAWIRPFSEVINSATAAGAANAYTLTNAPVMTAATAYRTGTTFTFKANHTNTGNATLNVDGLGARELRKPGGTDQLTASDILIGQMVTAIFDGTYFQMVSAEAPSVTPPPLTSYQSEIQPLPLTGTWSTAAHSIGSMPSDVRGMLVCVTAEAGFSVDDVIQIGAVKLDSGGAGDHEADAAEVYAYTFDATQVVLTRNSAANGQSPIIFHKFNGGPINFTPANWKFRFVALKYNP
jgi:hypothetical protein